LCKSGRELGVYEWIANDGKDKGIQVNDGDETKKNIMKRQEAEQFVAKLQRENPERCGSNHDASGDGSVDD
jgi:hypothetical protein